MANGLFPRVGQVGESSAARGITRGLQTGVQLRGLLQQQQLMQQQAQQQQLAGQQAAQRQRQLQELAPIALAGAGPESEQALAQIFALDPATGQAIQQRLSQQQQLGLQQQKFGLLQQQQRALGAQQQAQQAQQAQLQQLVPTALGLPTGGQTPGVPQQEQALAQIFATNPQLGKQLQEQLGFVDDKKRQDALSFALEVSETSPELRSQVIQDRASVLAAQGRDPTHTLNLLNMPESQRESAIAAMAVAALPPEKQADFLSKRRSLDEVIKSDFVEELGGSIVTKKGGDVGFKSLPADQRKQLKTELELSKGLDAQLKAETERFARANTLGRRLDSLNKGFKAKEARAVQVVNMLDKKDEKGRQLVDPTNDLAIVKNWIAYQDPTSTITGPEVQTEQRATGLLKTAIDMYGFLFENRGATLSPKQRAQIRDNIATTFDEARKLAKKEQRKIVNIGKRFGVAEADITGGEEFESLQDVPEFAPEAARLSVTERFLRGIAQPVIGAPQDRPNQPPPPQPAPAAPAPAPLPTDPAELHQQLQRRRSGQPQQPPQQQQQQRRKFLIFDPNTGRFTDG